MDENLYNRDRQRYYQEKFGVLRNNLQSLRALQIKYSRDYLPFYEALSSAYKVGPNKKAATEGVRKVNKIIVLLTNVIQGGTITAQDVSALYTLVDELEENRQYFLDQASKVQALQTKLEKISEETGVSLEDLGVSPEVARKAVRRDVRAGRAQTISVLRRQFPQTRAGVSRVLGGLGAAVAGPFTPLLRMGLGAGRDIFEFTGAVSRMLREARQRQFAAQFQPVAAGFPVEGLEQVLAARGLPPAVSAFRGVQQRRISLDEQTRPLYHFFEKGAYRAKWTKELLQSMQKAAKKERSLGALGLGRLASLFKGLGSAILPFIGKAGLA